MNILRLLINRIKGNLCKNGKPTVHLAKGLSYMEFHPFNVAVSSVTYSLLTCFHIERYPEFDGKNRVNNIRVNGLTRNRLNLSSICMYSGFWT